MIKAVARIAVARECRRFEWVCLNWNVNSIKFYKSLVRSRSMSGRLIASRTTT